MKTIVADVQVEKRKLTCEVVDVSKKHRPDETVVAPALRMAAQEMPESPPVAPAAGPAAIRVGTRRWLDKSGCDLAQVQGKTGVCSGRHIPVLVPKDDKSPILHDLGRGCNTCLQSLLPDAKHCTHTSVYYICVYLVHFFSKGTSCHHAHPAVGDASVFLVNRKAKSTCIWCIVSQVRKYEEAKAKHEAGDLSIVVPRLNISKEVREEAIVMYEAKVSAGTIVPLLARHRCPGCGESRDGSIRFAPPASAASTSRPPKLPNFVRALVARARRAGISKENIVDAILIDNLPEIVEAAQDMQADADTPDQMEV